MRPQDHTDAARVDSILAAKDAEITRLEGLVEFYRKAFPTEAQMAAQSAMRGKRATDPAEAMRARCEEIAWDFLASEHSQAKYNQALPIARAIAALKDAPQ